MELIEDQEMKTETVTSLLPLLEQIISQIDIPKMAQFFGLNHVTSDDRFDFFFFFLKKSIFSFLDPFQI